MENNIWIVGVVMVAMLMLWLDNRMNGRLDD